VYAKLVQLQVHTEQADNPCYMRTREMWHPHIHTSDINGEVLSDSMLVLFLVWLPLLGACIMYHSHLSESGFVAELIHCLNQFPFYMICLPMMYLMRHKSTEPTGMRNMFRILMVSYQLNSCMVVDAGIYVPSHILFTNRVLALTLYSTVVTMYLL
jgi:hypothetical protein